MNCSAEQAIISIAQALVKRPSVTPDDAGCQDFLQDQLQTMSFGCKGFSCRTLPFGKVKNLYAKLGSGSPHLLYLGHTDVVPAGDLSAWKHPPYAAVVDDGVLYGRGVCDMKGSVAAMIAALQRLSTQKKSVVGSLSILLTSDEEGDAVDGSAKALAALHESGERFDYCLVGEPTSTHTLGDTIKIGRRGSMRGECHVLGRQGHVAYPQHAQNAIERAARLIARISAESWDSGTEHFEPSNMQVYGINSASDVANVIPGSCTFRFACRYNTAVSPSTIRSRIQALADSEGIAIELSTQVTAEPFLSQTGTLSRIVIEAIEEVSAQKAQISTSGGTSDARFAIRYCDQIVEFGLINQTIHKVNECCSTQHLLQLSRIFESIVCRMILA